MLSAAVYVYSNLLPTWATILVTAETETRL